jgi:protein-S-isoprenylcysteine O-methyltransferase Ste14
MAVVAANVRNSPQVDTHRAVRVLLGIPLRFGIFLFLPAGTLIWPRAWLFVAVSLAEMAAQFAWLWRVNPEVVIARSRYHLDSKRWDKLLLCCYLPSTLAILLVAALDDGRFHWSNVPWSLSVLGLVLFVFGFVLITWAQSFNKFFESTVRIQSDRNQQVIASGPYKLVRHPGYLGSILVALGTALALGSFWALIPGAAASGLLVLRTKWEDQTLQQELVGYKAYADRVCCRLVPWRLVSLRLRNQGSAGAGGASFGGSSGSAKDRQDQRSPQTARSRASVSATKPGERSPR